jgi:hemoglobin-like flavoprotein
MALNVELLDQSFARIKPQSEAFTATFYATLFDRYPEVKPLFAHSEMLEQGKQLFASLVLVIDNLKKPDVLSNSLKGLGARHIKYGVSPQQYPMVGTALLLALEAHLGTDWTPDVAQAWTGAYGAVAELMLEGADYPNEILKL